MEQGGEEGGGELDGADQQPGLPLAQQGDGAGGGGGDAGGADRDGESSRQRTQLKQNRGSDRTDQDQGEQF